MFYQVILKCEDVNLYVRSATCFPFGNSVVAYVTDISHPPPPDTCVTSGRPFLLGEMLSFLQVEYFKSAAREKESPKGKPLSPCVLMLIHAKLAWKHL